MDIWVKIRLMNLPDEMINFIKNSAFLPTEYDFIPSHRKKILHDRIVNKKTFTEISKEFKRTPSAIRIQYIKGIKNLDLYFKTKKYDINSTFDILPLPARIRGCLSHLFEDTDIKTLIQLNNYSAKKILSNRNMGEKSMIILQDFMLSMGLSLYEDYNVQTDRRKYNLCLKLIDSLSKKILQLPLDQNTLIREELKKLYDSFQNIPSERSSIS